MSRVSVILPIYRTEPYLLELYNRLVETLKPLADFELVMVDDGSPDGAWESIVKLATQDPRIKAIRLSRNFGQHPAISAGFDHCTGDRVVLMDADLQDRPEDIPLLLSGLRGDVEIVFTVKLAGDGAPPTPLTSRLYHRVFSRLMGVQVPTDVGTFRAFTRRVLDALRRYPERHILYGPLMFMVGFHSLVVPIPYAPRSGGGSSYSFSKRLALAINSLVSYTDLPHRFLVAFGGSVLLATTGYAVALVVLYLANAESIPSGLTLLAMLITLSLGSTTIGLGIIGMYVFRVYEEALRRPRYLVARGLNLDPPSGVTHDHRG